MSIRTDLLVTEEVAESSDLRAAPFEFERAKRVEREILRERVRAGLAEARLNGKHLGQPPTAALQSVSIRKLYRVGLSEIARRLRMGRTSVRRILACLR